MDIKIGDKVRFNQLGLDTPGGSKDWWCIRPNYVYQAKNLGMGTVTDIRQRNALVIDFPGIPDFDWPVKFFEKIPEEEKLEFTREEKELLRELVQDKLKEYQQLLDKLQ